MKYSIHCAKRIHRKKTILTLGVINIEDYINLDSIRNGDLIEVYVDKGMVYKILVRVPFNGLYDLGVVVGINKDTFNVITFWQNSRKDVHTTLKTENYIKY